MTHLQDVALKTVKFRGSQPIKKVNSEREPSYSAKVCICLPVRNQTNTTTKQESLTVVESVE